MFRNRTLKLREIFHLNNLETFLPLKVSTSQPAPGKKIEKTRPAVAGLLFVKADLNQVLSLQKSPLSPEFSIYSLPDQNNHRQPAPIPDPEMERFKIVANAFATGIEYIDPVTAASILAEGKRVKVKDGIFKNAEGVVKRIKGSKRLIVEIKGVCAIATPYIPPSLLQPLD